MRILPWSLPCFFSLPRRPLYVLDHVELGHFVQNRLIYNHGKKVPVAPTGKRARRPSRSLQRNKLLLPHDGGSRARGNRRLLECEKGKRRRWATSRSSTRSVQEAVMKKRPLTALAFFPTVTVLIVRRGSSGFSALVPGCPNNCNCSRTLGLPSAPIRCRLSPPVRIPSGA